MKRKFTGYLDDNKNRIYVGDILECRDGYQVEVVMNSNKEFVGKLICKPGHSCENIPYSLNNGNGYVVIESGI